VEHGCDGPCTLELTYDGGVEMRICRWLPLLALIAAVWFGRSANRAADTSGG
jgi:hypothetical protein